MRAPLEAEGDGGESGGELTEQAGSVHAQPLSRRIPPRYPLTAGIPSYSMAVEVSVVDLLVTLIALETGLMGWWVMDRVFWIVRVSR